MNNFLRLFVTGIFLTFPFVYVTGQTDPVPGMGQANSYNDSAIISITAAGQPFYGQNTNHPGRIPSYTDKGNETVTDLATNLMWMQNDNGVGALWKNVLSYEKNVNYAGYSDLRLPDTR